MAGEPTKEGFSPSNGPRGPFDDRGRLQPIQMVDQLAKPARAPPIEVEDEPGEVP